MPDPSGPAGELPSVFVPTPPLGSPADCLLVRTVSFSLFVML